MASVEIVNFNEQSTKLSLSRFNKKFSLKKSIDKAIAVVVTSKSTTNNVSFNKDESKITIMDKIEDTKSISSLSPVKSSIESVRILKEEEEEEKKEEVPSSPQTTTPTPTPTTTTSISTTPPSSPSKTNILDCSLTHENNKCIGSGVTNATTTDNESSSCRHDGRELINAILPINIDSLFELIHTNSKFLADFHEEQKITETQHEEWKLNNENEQQKCRKFICKMPTKQNFGPKYSHIFEEQVLNEFCVPGKLYPVDILLWNEGIPYGEAFEVHKHHCFVKIDDNHTQFSVHMQVKFKKPIFLLVKAVIEKTAYKGMGELYTDLVETLKNQFGNSSDVNVNKNNNNNNNDDKSIESVNELSRCTSSITIN